MFFLFASKANIVAFFQVGGKKQKEEGKQTKMRQLAMGVFSRAVWGQSTGCKVSGGQLSEGYL